MNILEKIDEMVLTETQRIARFVYLIFGITNFGIARTCNLIASGMLVFSMALNTHVKSFNVVNTCGPPVLLGLIFLRQFFIEISGVRLSHKGFANINRLKYQGVRQAFLIVSPIYMLALSHSLFGVVCNTSSDKAGDLAFAFMQSAVILGFYVSICFESIEPEDPTDSLLKKGLKWLKGLFETSALPQPA